MSDLEDSDAATPADLAGWALALTQICDDLDSATLDPHLWDSPRGPYESALRALSAQAPEWEGEGILQRVYWDCTKYVSVMSRHGRSVASLVATGEVFVSIWPVLRAQLEAAGRIGWILEPHDGGEAVGPKRRAARYFMEQLASVCYLRVALKGLNSPHAGDARTVRARTVREIERLFGATLVWTGPESERDWVVGPDRYRSLAAGASMFAQHMAPGLEAIYAVLSGYSHPSPMFLRELLREHVNDTRRWTEWRVEPDSVRWQCWVSGVLQYRATTLLISHLEGPQEALGLTRFAGQPDYAA